MRHHIGHLVAAVLGTNNAIVQKRPGSGLTPQPGITRFDTRTESPIVTKAIQGCVRHRIEHFITEI